MRIRRLHKKENDIKRRQEGIALVVAEVLGSDLGERVIFLRSEIV